MSRWDWLTVAGAAVELIGFLVTLLGFRVTWHQFAPADERFTQPLWSAMTRARRLTIRTWARVRAVLARHPSRPDVPPAQTIRVSSVLGGSEVGTPTVIQHPGTLEGQVDLLRAKVQSLEDSHNRTYKRLVVEEQQRVADVARLGAQAAADRVQLETLSRTVAVDGLRTAALGLVVASGGLVMQAAASVLGSP